MDRSRPKLHLQVDYQGRHGFQTTITTVLNGSVIQVTDTFQALYLDSDLDNPFGHWHTLRTVTKDGEQVSYPQNKELAAEVGVLPPPRLQRVKTQT